ncbi:hypothetical protein Tco_0882486 [Tanacetum coccineum]
MHNDIMAVGSKDSPPMLAIGRYAQWQSPKPVTNIKEVVPEHNVPKTYKNTTPKKHAYFDAEAKAIHMILSGIGYDIYTMFPIDACTTAKETWVAIERLQQGKSLNKQDVKTNLFWEFSKFTSRGFGHMAKECKKPKRVEDYAYHKDKTMLCKQEEKGVPLSVDLRDWLDDTNEELNEQELEAHYMYMAKIQEVLTAESGPTFNAEPLEKVQFNDDYNVFANERQHSKQPEFINDTYVVDKVDSNVIPDSSDMCDNEGLDDQNVKEYKDERVMLANLIANLKLDTDENKKI